MRTQLEKLLTLAFVCITIFVSAQKQLIIGTVFDDTQPLPGASVKIKGLSKIPLQILMENSRLMTSKKASIIYR
ncbi:carboxypeptidase-like regulatory domain-containing protein [Chryseobacterium carnipullorum]|uniref:carboxypeptidase-like regulatory domain-containing protein n=1 Tax=Chryseobacterium carnipullorum TaxID=1124835 RepID=UPI001E5F6FD9|nr:carboxypeptidase-like regulatory domain-containing protein [Chryseobacterium carnipullorum]